MKGKRRNFCGKVKDFHLIFIVIKGKICYNIVKAKVKSRGLSGFFSNQRFFGV